MIKKLFLAVCLAISGAAFAAPAPFAPAEDTTQTARTRFEQLSPEELLGQTLTVSVDVDSADVFRSVIEKGQVGHILIQWGNYSLEQTRALIEKLQQWAANSPHKIPLLVSIDYEGGTVYTPITLGFDYFPTNMMMSATRDEGQVATLAYLAGLELKRAGVHVNFSPVLDVNSNPNNPIIGVRSFGSDPRSVTKMGLALMSGFNAAGLVSVVKHFPGHGDTSQDSHYQVPIVKLSDKQLREVHLAPFAQAIKHGVQGVMTSHVIYPAFDKHNVATFSKPILHDILRGQLHFKGLVFTDSLDMKATSAFCTLPNCAARALLTGADVVLLGRFIKPQKTFQQIFRQMQNNPELAARVRQSARKVFELKQKLGLLDGPQDPPAPTDQAYATALEQVSRQAVTLVRDRRRQLPVSPNATDKKPVVCAVFFAPSRFADQLVSFTKPFLEKGWQARTYNAALTPKTVDAKRARECAAGADLLVLGSLQWADKANVNQKNTIAALMKEHPHTILISTMSPYDVLHYPQADILLATYGLNKYVLQAAADIILGNQTAQGKLPVALPQDVRK